MFTFANRVVLVTGAAGNLGVVVSRAFGGAGAHLVLVDRASERLPVLFPDLAGHSDHYLATSVDLLDGVAVETMTTEAVKRYGKIDVLVNAAGGYRAGSLLDADALATWEHMFDLNARSALNVSRAVVPVMLKQGGGRIVNVASRAALSGGAQTAAYSAAKSAVLRLTESMAAEFKSQGINVNCVLPGTLDTPQNREAMPQADTSRWVTLEAVADVILFLASDAARAVHGAAVPVYGLG